MVPEIKQKLNEQQRRAVTHTKGPLLVAAGAGSGKTRTLTARITHLLQSGVAPEHIIAITFTNKAAGEMRERIFGSRERNTSPLFIGTFHALGARILKDEAARLGRSARYTIFDEEDSLQLLKRILKEININHEQYRPAVVRAVISRTKNELRDDVDDRTLHRVFRRYEEMLQASNAFDFDDLITKVVAAYEQYPDVLAAYQNRWQHILIDEFQDVNTSQYRLVQLLAQRHHNIWAVGDDFQSIFGFRGADFRNFLHFEKDWPTAKIILLEQNYRSDRTIIEAANGVIRHNRHQKQKTIWTENKEGNPVTVVAAADEEGEASWVADHVLGLMRTGEALDAMAVLYRTNAQSRAIEYQLLARKIPYRIFGGLRFYERKEIKDMLAALRFAYNPLDIVSRERLRKQFPKKVAAQLEQELPQRGAGPLLELIDFFLAAADFRALLKKHHTNHEERWENVHELIVFAGTFAEQGIGPFLEHVSLASAADTSASERGVQLMSIHLAKGLEFHHVFVIGCSEGVLPHQHSFREPAGIEEERRLMYVAMTRARTNLFLTFHGLPSRFLYEIPPELVVFQAPHGARKNMYEEDEDEKYIEYE